MDFRTKVGNRSFAVRATGLLVQDGGLYLVKSPEGINYTLGGAIQVGEATEEAVRREMREEIGIDVRVEAMVFVVENQFELAGTCYHQIEFQYLVSPLSRPARQLAEGATIRSCEWVTFADLKQLNLNPAFLKTELATWNGQVKYHRTVTDDKGEQGLDFRTRQGNRIFGVRAAGLIIKDGKIFLTKDDKGRYYTIGGAIKVGESAQDAVVREVKEELGVDSDVNQLAFVVENQFTHEGVNFHNIEFHFIIQPLGDMPNEMLEGGIKQTCEWIELDNLVNIDIVPRFLTEALANWNGQITHLVNENN